MAVAWIAFAGGVIAALVSAVVALRQSQMAERLARVSHDLDVEKDRRAALLDRDLRAEEVLTRYREPLAAAAFDLQSRLYNILELEFFAKFGDGERSEDALETTLFRLAQYFGWTEILRRDIQFLSFPEAQDTRRVAKLQADIARCFLRDDYADGLMIWSDEQRGLGERMIVADDGRVLCMGYATFRDRDDEVFGRWRKRLAEAVSRPDSSVRLRDVQHLLCELVETLDSNRVRYTENLQRA